MKLKNRGFTLIELMIVVAIIGLLASIVYPNYQETVEKSRRSDVKGAMIGFANAMERYFTVNNTYLGAAGTNAVPANTGLSRIYAIQSPVGGGTATYDLKINAAAAASYTLIAERTGSQANDKCGDLTLTQTGLKGLTNADGGVVVADCW